MKNPLRYPLTWLALVLSGLVSAPTAAQQHRLADIPNPGPFPLLRYEPCDIKNIVTNPTAPAANPELPAKINTFNWHYGPQQNGQ